MRQKLPIADTRGNDKHVSFDGVSQPTSRGKGFRKAVLDYVFWLLEQDLSIVAAELWDAICTFA